MVLRRRGSFRIRMCLDCRNTHLPRAPSQWQLIVWLTYPQVRHRGVLNLGWGSHGFSIRTFLKSSSLHLRASESLCVHPQCVSWLWNPGFWNPFCCTLQVPPPRGSVLREGSCEAGKGRRQFMKNRSFQNRGFPISDARAARKGMSLRGQTPICGYLRVPAVFCGSLRKSAVFCENLRFPNASFLGKGENLQKLAKICVWARFFPWGLSPQAHPEMRWRSIRPTMFLGLWNSVGPQIPDPEMTFGGTQMGTETNGHQNVKFSKLRNLPFWYHPFWYLLGFAETFSMTQTRLSRVRNTWLKNGSKNGFSPGNSWSHLVRTGCNARALCRTYDFENSATHAPSFHGAQHGHRDLGTLCPSKLRISGREKVTWSSLKGVLKQGPFCFQIWGFYNQKWAALALKRPFSKPNLNRTGSVFWLLSITCYLWFYDVPSYPCPNREIARRQASRNCQCTQRNAFMTTPYLAP